MTDIMTMQLTLNESIAATMVVAQAVLALIFLHVGGNSPEMVLVLQAIMWINTLTGIACCARVSKEH